ncbi:MAG: T9SS type A sorting domain-containing protein [Bacteroidia bacterium]
MKSVFLLAGFLALAPGISKANLLGAEMRYNLIDDSLFVYLNTYDDYAFGRSSRIDLNLYISSNNSKKSIRTQFALNSTTDITATCANSCSNYSNNTCNNPNTLVKLQYSAAISISEFSTTDCELELEWSSYYRPESYERYYLSSTVFTCIDGNNSSPEIINDPYHIIQFNEPYSYSWIAEDDDKDSLVYELIEAKTSSNSTFSYQKGLNHKAPFNYLGQPRVSTKFPRGFHFDNNNGLLRFYPTKTMASPVVVKVSEFRNGEKVGETIREIYMSVKSVSNKKPIISGINGGNKEEISACANQELCFYIEAEDDDVEDLINFSWDTDMPNASIGVKRNKKSTLQICWTPTNKDLVKGSFYLKVLAKDNSCELEGRYERVFKVNVTETFSAKIDYQISACKEAMLNVKTSLKNDQKLHYEWSIENEEYFGQNLTYNYLKGGSKELSLSISDELTGCSSNLVKTISLPKTPTVSVVGESQKCANSEISLAAKGASTYSWSNSNGLLGTEEILVHSFKNDQIIYLKGIDKYGCEDTDTFSLDVLEPKIDAVALENTVCRGLKFEIEASNAQDYSWSKSGLKSFDENNAVYQLNRNETIEVSGTDDNGCFGTKEVLLYVDQDCVWPGDINGDEYVNNRDVLMLGLAYGTNNTSEEKSYKSPVWLPYRSENWEHSFGDNRNFKHADPNHDGIIDYEDLLIIDRFYNREITYTNKKNNTGYKLYFDFDIDSVKGKQIIEIDVNLGTSVAPAKNVYGIAFTIDYNNFIDTSSISFNTEKSWLNDGSNTIKLVKNIPNKGTNGGGKIDIAFSRTSKKPKSGSGKVGSVKFVVQDNIDWKKNQFIELLLEGIEIVNEKGEKLEAYGEAASIEVTDLISSTNSISSLSGLSSFPNPTTNGTLFISINDSYENAQVSILNLAGQLVLSPTMFQSGIHNLNVGSFESGYYLLVFETELGKHTTPIVIR